jgi:hypothetical protein
MSEQKETVLNDKDTENNLDKQQKVEEKKVDAKINLNKGRSEDQVYKVDLTKKPESNEESESLKEGEQQENENKLQSSNENNESANPIKKEGEEQESVLELITDEEDEPNDNLKAAAERYKETQETPKNKDTGEFLEDEGEESDAKEVNPYADIEGLDKLAKFIKETGGSVEDYVRATSDYSSASDEAVIKQYLKDTKKNFSDEDLDFYIEDKFGYDEDIDDEKDIKRKKLAFKEAAANARQHLETLKDKYYSDVKLNSKLSPEQKEAVEFYQKYKNESAETQDKQKKQRVHFEKETEQVFSDDFKGFDFKIGENKYRYKVSDTDTVKQSQSDLGKFLGDYFDSESGILKDAKGYHKTLYAGKNIDKIAEHFYNQGRAEALQDADAKAKNINMDGRRTSQDFIQAGGIKVKVLDSGESNQMGKVKLPKRFQKNN